MRDAEEVSIRQEITQVREVPHCLNLFLDIEETSLSSAPNIQQDAKTPNIVWGLQVQGEGRN